MWVMSPAKLHAISKLLPASGDVSEITVTNSRPAVS
jgi:hypothetical protein